MSAALFLCVLLTSAAALALWLDLRLPSLAPEGLTLRFVAAAVAGGLANAGATAFPHALGSRLGLVPPELVALGVILPPLVASLLTALWLLRSLGSVARSR